MANPEVVRRMMMSNPQTREVMENNPEVAQMLNDPSFLRQVLHTLSLEPLCSSRSIPTHIFTAFLLSPSLLIVTGYGPQPQTDEASTEKQRPGAVKSGNGSWRIQSPSTHVSQCSGAYGGLSQCTTALNRRLERTVCSSTECRHTP